MSTRSKDWVITWNNPPFSGTDDQIISKAKAFFGEKIESGDLVYAAFQLERGANNTLHLQGYFQFSRNQRISAGRRMCPGSYLEQRKGSHDQARDYCRKEDTRAEGTEPVELGEARKEGAGRRTDLEDVRRPYMIRTLDFSDPIAPCA